MKTIGQIFEEVLNELSGKTLVGYIHKSKQRAEKIRKVSFHHLHKMTSLRLSDPKMEHPDNKKHYDAIHKETRHIMRRLNNHAAGEKRAYKHLENR